MALLHAALEVAIFMANPQDQPAILLLDEELHEIASNL